MNKCIPLCLALGLMLGGCGAADTTATTTESTTAVATPEPVAEATPAAQVTKNGKVSKKDAKADKNAKQEVLAVPAQCKHPYGKEVQLKNGHKVCCLLDATGKQLTQKAARTITPNKANKQVKQVGKEYIATYIHIDADAVSTSMTPSTVTKGNYVGRISYSETTYQCKGKTKKEALAATNCTSTGSRRVTEMINFDGKKWNY